MEWFPAITTTSLFGIALWLSRNLIMTRLTNAVRHEYNEKLETLKSELRVKEESIKSDLAQKESQIQALSSGALSGLSARNMVIFNKKVEAVERLWEVVVSLSTFKSNAHWLQYIKFEEFSKWSAENPQFRHVMSSFIGMDELVKLESYKLASMARPFIDSVSWAYYSAYSSVILHAALQMEIIKKGLDMAKFVKNDEVIKAVKEALPHHSPGIEKYGVQYIYLLLDELENCILTSLKKALNGVEYDEETIKRSIEIIKQSEAAMNYTQQTAMSEDLST